MELIYLLILVTFFAGISTGTAIFAFIKQLWMTFSISLILLSFTLIEVYALLGQISEVW